MWFNRHDDKEDEPGPDDGSVKEMLEDARIYLEKRIELLMLSFVERFTFILADAVQRLAGLVIFALGAFFFWFALSFMVSEWVGSTALGFLITSVPLLLSGAIFLWIQPGRVRRAIQVGMIRQFLRAFDDAAGKGAGAAKEQRSATSGSPGSSGNGESGKSRSNRTPRPTLSNEGKEKG
ncbi:MAG: hypothetical protein ACQER4_09755 [Bacteroidota bacterium]